MPRKRWIDKNSESTKTFQLYYRPQADPLIHDESSHDRSLMQTAGPATAQSTSEPGSKKKILHMVDLEDEVDYENVRENEGEAANYGIYYDDTSYDYMQHLREIGEGAGQAHFVDSTPVQFADGGKGKTKMVKLEDALRQSSLDERKDSDGVVGDLAASEVMDDGLSNFSSSTRPRTYQDMQDVPDEIAGFQPGMDPRLREALQALDDEAYVEDEQDDDDIFGALTHGGQHAEVDLAEFEAMQEDDEDEPGWESDVTEKASKQPSRADRISAATLTAAPADPTDISSAEAEAASAEDGDWLRDFAKFRRDKAANPTPRPTARDPAAPPRSDINAPSASALYTQGDTPLRQKRRNGALTNPTTYSMTSSSLARTDGQRLLDDRFDKIEEIYSLDEAGDIDEDEDEDEDDGGISLASGLSKRSKLSTTSTGSFADGAVRGDLDGMMDGFLQDWTSNYAGAGGKRNGAKGKRGKNGNEAVGIQMLDEMRRGLGPARVGTQRVKMDDLNRSI